MKLRTMQILGANRAGNAFTEGATRQPMGVPLSVQLVDPVPGRATALARRWEACGIPTEALTANDTDVRRPCDIRVAAFDDSSALAQLLAEEPQEAQLVYSSMISVPTTERDGGIVLGIGGTLLRENPALRHQASDLAHINNRLAGEERTSSRLISSQVLSSTQVSAARRTLHYQLAADVSAYLAGTPREGIYITEATAENVYPLVYMERTTPAQELRGSLRRRALELVAGTPIPAAAVLFASLDPAWGYCVLLYRRHEGSPLRVRRAIELGAPPIAGRALARTFITD